MHLTRPQSLCRRILAPGEPLMPGASSHGSGDTAGTGHGWAWCPAFQELLCGPRIAFTPWLLEIKMLLPAPSGVRVGSALPSQGRSAHSAPGPRGATHSGPGPHRPTLRGCW